MTIFAVLTEPDNALIVDRLSRLFPSAYRISPGQHLISKAGITSAQLAEEIGTKGEYGNFVVFAVESYWGWHQKSLWEWVKANSAS